MPGILKSPSKSIFEKGKNPSKRITISKKAKKHDGITTEWFIWIKFMNNLLKMNSPQIAFLLVPRIHRNNIFEKCVYFVERYFSNGYKSPILPKGGRIYHRFITEQNIFILCNLREWILQNELINQLTKKTTENTVQNKSDFTLCEACSQYEVEYDVAWSTYYCNYCGAPQIMNRSQKEKNEKNVKIYHDENDENEYIPAEDDIYESDDIWEEIKTDLSGNSINL